jgi:hypothetical protein
VQDSITSAAQLLGSLAAPVLVAGRPVGFGGGCGVMLVGTLLTAPGLDKVSLRTDDNAVVRLRWPIGCVRWAFGDAPQATPNAWPGSSQLRSVAAGEVLFARRCRDLYGAARRLLQHRGRWW